MSTSPQPINALKTRVVQIDQDRFMPQCSTDGMIWFDLGVKDQGLIGAHNIAKSIIQSASRTPSSGEVVWKSY